MRDSPLMSPRPHPMCHVRGSQLCHSTMLTICPSVRQSAPKHKAHMKKNPTLNIQLFPHNVQQWIDPSLMDFVYSPSDVGLNQTKQVCHYLVKWQKKKKMNTYQLQILIGLNLLDRHSCSTYQNSGVHLLSPWVPNRHLLHCFKYWLYISLKRSWFFFLF